MNRVTIPSYVRNVLDIVIVCENRKMSIHSLRCIRD